MNIDEAKIIIDKQLEKVIYADAGYVLNNLHPIRVIQSLKSIIGIDMDSPNEKLIQWGEEYSNGIDRLSEDYFKYSIKKPKETIVLSYLEKYILSEDHESCIRELQDLCLVSDGNQIFEYLIEFSSLHNRRALSFIWSAYRINIFMKNKFSYQLLFLSVQSLLKNQFSGDGVMFKIDNSSVIESIKSTLLTRSVRINRNLSNCNLRDVFFNIGNSCSVEIDVLTKGRYALLEYLNNLDFDKITKELILFLDACRMVLKNSNDYDSELANIINQVVSGGLYVKENW